MKRKNSNAAVLESTTADHVIAALFGLSGGLSEILPSLANIRINPTLLNTTYTTCMQECHSKLMASHCTVSLFIRRVIQGLITKVNNRGTLFGWPLFRNLGQGGIIHS